jgi:hypothetical protein
LSEESDIESILNRVRIYRELIGDSEDLEYKGIKGSKFARDFDSAICSLICDIVGSNSSNEPDPHSSVIV